MYGSGAKVWGGSSGGVQARALPVPDYSSMPWNSTGFAMGQVNASNAATPGFLQISPTWGQPEQQLATTEYMNNIVNPAKAQQYSLDNAAGSAQSTFSAARNSDIETRGARQAMLAGLDAKNAAIQQKIAERSSYYNVPTDPGLANRLYDNAKQQYAANNQNYQVGQSNSANRLAGAIGAGIGVAPYAYQFGSGLLQGMFGSN